MRPPPHFVFAVALAIVVPTIAAPSHAGPRPPEDTILSEARTTLDEKGRELFPEFEPKALAASGGRAERRERVLVLRYAASGEQHYTDHPDCFDVEREENCVRYAFLAHAPSKRVFVVLKLYYEWSEYLLVNTTDGQETVLRSFPHFSPSGRSLALAISNDEEVGSVVQMWSRRGTGFALDWSGTP